MGYVDAVVSILVDVWCLVGPFGDFGSGDSISERAWPPSSTGPDSITKPVGLCGYVGGVCIAGVLPSTSAILEFAVYFGGGNPLLFLNFSPGISTALGRG